MPELKPHIAWINECRRRGWPLDTPAPPEYQSYDEWYRNTRGVNPYTGRRALKDFGDWIFEKNRLGLPYDAPAPEGNESEAEWFRRTRGMNPDGTKLKDDFVEAPRRLAFGPRRDS